MNYSEYDVDINIKKKNKVSYNVYINKKTIDSDAYERNIKRRPIT